MSTREFGCQEPMLGMYVPYSKCGRIAEYRRGDGHRLCTPCARRAVLNGEIVAPPIECAVCELHHARQPCAGCPRRSGDERCPQCDGRLRFSHRRVVCRVCGS